MLKSVTFEVIGDQRIFCESCEHRIERMLNSLEGMRQVRAKARDQRVEVLFDTELLEPTLIADRLSKAGYETRIRMDGSDSE